MVDSQKVEQSLANIEKLALRLSQEVALLRKDRKLDDLMKEMPPLEAAKLNSSLGYLVNCLYKSSPSSRSLHEGQRHRRDRPQDLRRDRAQPQLHQEDPRNRDA
jgi:hypothetical protein